MTETINPAGDPVVRQVVPQKVQGDDERVDLAPPEDERDDGLLSPAPLDPDTTPHGDR